jgi:hypothetical protein
MKRQLISALVAIAVVAVATTMLRSHASDRPAEPAGLMTLQELHSGDRVNKLPVEEFEDQSLVYSTTVKR